MLSKIISFLKGEPAAAYVTALGTIVALIVAFGHLSGTQAGYLSTIATAVGAIITACLARPVGVAVISGAVGSVLEALVLFSVHVSSAEEAAIVGGLNLILGYLVMRPQLEPLVTRQKRQQAAKLRAPAR